MSTRYIVFAAVFAFILAWGTLMTLAARSLPPPAAGPGVLSKSPAHHGFSGDEITRHNRPDDCWIVIRGKVYDVSDYIPSHPAPRRTITEHCGKESTWAFETKERGRPHSTQAWQLLDRYLVGEVRD